MTGYGRGAGEVLGRRMVVETRSVNHRFLELKLRLPYADAQLEALISQTVRRRVERGAVTVALHDEGAAGGSGVTMRRVRVDLGLAQDYRQALEELRTSLGLSQAISLELVAAQEGVMLTGEPPADAEAFFDAFRPVLEASLEALGEMRRREGQALAEDLRGRLAAFAQIVREIQDLAAQAPDALRRRLEERLARALPSGAVEPGRLAQEVALLADRADVTEELTRLASHCAQMAALLAAPSAVGRKLDFLLQEMGREINTIGSKSQDAGVAQRVVAAKAELEKLREQVQNVE